MQPKITPSGAALLGNGNIGDGIGSHLTITADQAGGIMKIHDTFQIRNKSINLSGPNYNNINGTDNTFNPTHGSAEIMADIFKK